MYVSTPPRLPLSYLQPTCLQLPKPWFNHTTLLRPHPYIYSNTRDNCCWRGENLSYRCFCVPINPALTLCLHGRMLTGWSNRVQLSNLWHHTWLHGQRGTFQNAVNLWVFTKQSAWIGVFFFFSLSSSSQDFTLTDCMFIGLLVKNRESHHDGLAELRMKRFLWLRLLKCLFNPPNLICSVVFAPPATAP